MPNPDPTQFIAITDHVSALRLQQAEFDAAMESLRSASAEKESLDAALDQIAADIANDSLDAEATVLAIAAKVSDAKKPARDKEIAKLEADRDALDARIDAIKNPKPSKD